MGSDVWEGSLAAVWGATAGAQHAPVPDVRLEPGGAARGGREELGRINLDKANHHHTLVPPASYHGSHFRPAAFKPAAELTRTQSAGVWSLDNIVRATPAAPCSLSQELRSWAARWARLRPAPAEPFPWAREEAWGTRWRRRSAEGACPRSRRPRADQRRRGREKGWQLPQDPRARGGGKQRWPPSPAASAGPMGGSSRTAMAQGRLG